MRLSSFQYSRSMNELSYLTILLRRQDWTTTASLYVYTSPPDLEQDLLHAYRVPAKPHARIPRYVRTMSVVPSNHIQLNHILVPSQTLYSLYPMLHDVDLHHARVCSFNSSPVLQISPYLISLLFALCANADGHETL